MSDIKIVGFDNIETLLAETHNKVSLILEAHRQQPELDALLGCINAMQSAVERVIVAYEELAGGETPVSKEARHAMNAAQMLKHLNGKVPWSEWVFPEEQSEQVFEKATSGQSFAKATRLVKKTAPAKKGKRK